MTQLSVPPPAQSPPLHPHFLSLALSPSDIPSLGLAKLLHFFPGPSNSPFPSAVINICRQLNYPGLINKHDRQVCRHPKNCNPRVCWMSHSETMIINMLLQLPPSLSGSSFHKISKSGCGLTPKGSWWKRSQVTFQTNHVLPLILLCAFMWRKQLPPRTVATKLETLYCRGLHLFIMGNSADHQLAKNSYVSLLNESKKHSKLTEIQLYKLSLVALDPFLPNAMWTCENDTILFFSKIILLCPAASIHQ